MNQEQIKAMGFKVITDNNEYEKDNWNSDDVMGAAYGSGYNDGFVDGVRTLVNALVDELGV